MIEITEDCIAYEIAGKYRLEMDLLPGLATERAKVAYRLTRLSDNKSIFEGEDFSPSPQHSVDGIEAVCGLLGFLTLKPGDTDQEYFDDYTPEQLEWCQGNDAEEIGLIVYDIENDLEEYKAEALEQIKLIED